VQSAVDADTKGDFQNAIALYEKSLVCLAAASQSEQDLSRKSVIDGKISEYFARVQILRQRHGMPISSPHPSSSVMQSSQSISSPQPPPQAVSSSFSSHVVSSGNPIPSQDKQHSEFFPMIVGNRIFCFYFSAF
jgi:hypothetical protein